MYGPVDSAVGAVERRVESREWEGKPARAVIAVRSYPTDAADLWDAITDPERMKRWFTPVSGDLQQGGRYQLEGNAGGTISRCEPPRLLAVTWEFGGGTSWVNVMLDAEGDESTRLTLEHIGHEEADYLAFWEQYGPGAVGVGWDLSLLGLAEHLKSGAGKPPGGEEEWMKGDEGRAFAGGYSEAWRAADAAFGTDAKAAREAAERTRAFYTGVSAGEASS